MLKQLAVIKDGEYFLRTRSKGALERLIEYCNLNDAKTARRASDYLIKFIKAQKNLTTDETFNLHVIEEAIKSAVRTNNFTRLGKIVDAALKDISASTTDDKVIIEKKSRSASPLSKFCAPETIGRMIGKLGPRTNRYLTETLEKETDNRLRAVAVYGLAERAKREKDPGWLAAYLVKKINTRNANGVRNALNTAIGACGENSAESLKQEFRKATSIMGVMNLLEAVTRIPGKGDIFKEELLAIIRNEDHVIIAPLDEARITEEQKRFRTQSRETRKTIIEFAAKMLSESKDDEAYLYSAIVSGEKDLERLEQIPMKVALKVKNDFERALESETDEKARREIKRRIVFLAFQIMVFKTMYQNQIIPLLKKCNTEMQVELVKAMGNVQNRRDVPKFVDALVEIYKNGEEKLRKQACESLKKLAQHQDIIGAIPFFVEKLARGVTYTEQKDILEILKGINHTQYRQALEVVKPHLSQNPGSGVFEFLKFLAKKINISEVKTELICYAIMYSNAGKNPIINNHVIPLLRTMGDLDCEQIIKIIGQGKATENLLVPTSPLKVVDFLNKTLRDLKNKLPENDFSSAEQQIGKITNYLERLRLFDQDSNLDHIPELIDSLAVGVVKRPEKLHLDLLGGSFAGVSSFKIIFKRFGKEKANLISRRVKARLIEIGASDDVIQSFTGIFTTELKEYLREKRGVTTFNLGNVLKSGRIPRPKRRPGNRKEPRRFRQMRAAMA